MVELLAGFVLTIASLLIGYSLGKHESALPPDMKKQINQIFRKVVPHPEVGPVERPDAKQNYYRDNPKVLIEDEIMEKEFDSLYE